MAYTPKFTLVFFVFFYHFLLAASGGAVESGSLISTHHADPQELRDASHILHMMWIADKPENRQNIREVVSKAYEWAQLDPAIHVIVWHNDATRRETFFPRETGIRKMVTIRHISAVCVEAPHVIRGLPCNISRKKESLADDLSAVLPTLLGETSEVNVYIKCDLAKILMMYYQAQKYSQKGFMYADSTIRPHKISELWAAYQPNLLESGIVMANMAFPKSLEERQAMIAEDPRISEKGATYFGFTTPGFENSSFLADCRHKIMLSVMGATFLRPLASGSIRATHLNIDDEGLFFLMNVSFFYLNLVTHRDTRLFIVDPKALFSACGEDLIRQHKSCQLSLQELRKCLSNILTDEKAPVRLQGSLLQKYSGEDVSKAAIVETVMRGGFVQDVLTGKIRMQPLTLNGLHGNCVKKEVLAIQQAESYEIGDLSHLAVPIMDKHTLLTKSSHFCQKKEVHDI